MYTEDSDRRFYALSVGSHSDLGNSICVCNNVLRLSLTPESYSRLGLTGRRSSQVKGSIERQNLRILHSLDRYIVDIKLNGNCFKPGCHFYERVIFKCKEYVIFRGFRFKRCFGNLIKNF